jgi:division protein CdvB (Snf7/Vps24/ESCRT-III family)
VFSSDGKTNEVKDRITYAMRQVEIQRKDLEQLRFKLEERRRTMFDATVKAIKSDDDMRARVLAGEHVELQKIGRVVEAAELALLHIIVRLETIRDVGDIMYVLNNAFKAVKKIEKQISDIAPGLENSAVELNEALAHILAELGVITPNVSIGITDSPSEIFEKAQKLISERTSELSELPKSIQNIGELNEDLSIFERTKRVALLATVEDSEGEGLEDSEFKPILLSSSDELVTDSENVARNYIEEIGVNNVNIGDASAQLNLPVDLVEQAYIKVLREEKFERSKPQQSRSKQQPQGKHRPEAQTATASMSSEH